MNNYYNTTIMGDFSAKIGFKKQGQSHTCMRRIGNNKLIIANTLFKKWTKPVGILNTSPHVKATGLASTKALEFYFQTLF